MMNMPQGAPMAPPSRDQVPPGAMPKEVADDVPIMASEGEFVVPADVVRFLGLEKLEGLVNKAKESLSQMQQGGRIGGKPPPPPQGREAPPPQGMPSEPMGGPPRPPGMAEGGVVAPTSQQAPTGSPAPSMMAYEGPDGKMVYIPFINGQPLTPIPAGYRPASAVRQAVQGGGGGGDFFNALGGNRPQTPSSPDQWSVDQFINYGQQLESGVPDVARNIAGVVLPFSNILFGLAERNMQNTVPQMIDTMIETGVDSQGNPLTDEQREGLLNTRNVMGERMAQERGSRFNPFESLSNLVGRLTGNNGAPSGQRATNSMSSPSASTQSRGQVTPSGGAPSGPTSMSASGNMTTAPEKEEKETAIKGFAYGGLVNKGAGFMRKPPPIKKQPVPRAYEEGGLVRLPAIGAQPRTNVDQPRGFLARELGQAANEPGRFNPQSTTDHNYRGEEDVVEHVLSTFKSFLSESRTEGEAVTRIIEALENLNFNRPDTPSFQQNEEDIAALRARVGV